jgi:hypothetical protein
MTIGDMIDQLTIANIKLWHIEDERREFAKQESCDVNKAKELLEKVAYVNRERNNLIDKINASIRVLVDWSRNNNSNFILTAEDLLGTGKNKFYKKEDYDDKNK